MFMEDSKLTGGHLLALKSSGSKTDEGMMLNESNESNETTNITNITNITIAAATPHPTGQSGRSSCASQYRRDATRALRALVGRSPDSPLTHTRRRAVFSATASPPPVDEAGADINDQISELLEPEWDAGRSNGRRQAGGVKGVTAGSAAFLLLHGTLGAVPERVRAAQCLTPAAESGASMNRSMDWDAVEVPLSTVPGWGRSPKETVHPQPASMAPGKHSFQGATGHPPLPKHSLAPSPGHRWIAHSGRPLDAADRAPGRPQGPIHSACSGAASPPQGRPPQWVVHGTLQLRLSSSCLSSGAASTPTSPKPANHSRRKIFVLAKAGRPWSVGSDS
ncbi:hypothetical protein ACCO45_006657 [Purpureocillium lilacinum]|uniref:Uncharacterized protein n=1 Tax=Purpureocillium lilacinum TaxID=33203 RepID=A0ACC4DQ41_PURLI